MTAAALTTVDVAVVGGGIAGLAAAWRAHQAGLSVCVLESSKAVGGKMRSERRDGYLVEHGPTSFLASATALWHLIDGVGLSAEVIAAAKPADRFVYRDRKARKLPSDLGTLLAGDYLSAAGKLRLFAELAVPGNAQPQDTVWDFACRRIGAEAARYLIGPFVSGVYAGDPAQLGARDAFPKMWQWEHESGSLTLGALFAHDPADGPVAPVQAPARGMYSLREGLGALPKALAAALPLGTVLLQAPVVALERQGRQWLVRTHPTLGQAHPPLLAKQVIVAVPAHAAAELLEPLVPAIAGVLADVVQVRVAVVHIGGPDPQRVAPRGFGVLIPRGEGLRTLGILLPSAMFAQRAPQGHWLHTAFLGGANDPEAVDLPDETLISLAVRAQSDAFGLTGDRALEQTFGAVVRWREAIVQYRVGHRETMATACRTVTQRCPGLGLAGSHLSGISMADAAHSGLRAADTAIAALAAGAEGA